LHINKIQAKNKQKIITKTIYKILLISKAYILGMRMKNFRIHKQVHTFNLKIFVKDC